MIGLIFTGGCMKSGQERSNCENGVCSIEKPHNSSTDTAQEESLAASESHVVGITTENFNALISNGTKPVIIDFYATWCQPCTHMKPIFAQLAQEESSWIFGAIDVDKAPTLMNRCGITAMPTFVIFKNGIQWGSIKGMLEKEQLKAELNKIMQSDSPATPDQQDQLLQVIIAISQRNVDSVKQLIATGINLNGILETPQGNSSALQAAITNSTEEIIDILINSGAIMDSSVEESTKKQLVFFAKTIESLNQNFIYAKNRIASLATPIIQNAIVEMPELSKQYMIAIHNPETLKKLLDEGADVNAVFLFGKYEITPLYLAMVFFNTPAIDMLIDAGASLETKIIHEDGATMSVEKAIEKEIETGNLGIVNSHKRLNYAMSKVAV